MKRVGHHCKLYVRMHVLQIEEELLWKGLNYHSLLFSCV